MRYDRMTERELVKQIYQYERRVCEIAFDAEKRAARQMVQALRIALAKRAREKGEPRP